MSLETKNALPRNRFDCLSCGTSIAADEDGCCATCGRQTVTVENGVPDYRGVLAGMEVEEEDAFALRAALAAAEERPTKEDYARKGIEALNWKERAEAAEARAEEAERLVEKSKTEWRSLVTLREHMAAERLAEARAVLREVEWRYDGACPVCINEPQDGHNPTCRLARALSADPGET